MSGSWPRFALQVLARPGRALARFPEDEALPMALRLYALYLACAVLFYALKPADFPPQASDAPFAASGGGLLFWAKAYAWEPLLGAFWVLFLGAYARWLSGGRLAARLALLALGSLFGPASLVLYAKSGLGRPALAAAWLLALGLCLPTLKAVPGRAWRALATLAAAVNAPALALLPLFTLAVLARAPSAYHGLEIVLLFWTLGLATFLLSGLQGLSKPRAFCAVFLSMLAQLCLVFALNLLGLLPKEVLKALLPA